MSVILDALKKAQNERKGSDKPENPQPEDPKNRNKRLIIIALLGVAFLVLAYIVPDFLKPKVPVVAQKPQGDPVAAVPVKGTGTTATDMGKPQTTGGTAQSGTYPGRAGKEMGSPGDTKKAPDEIAGRSRGILAGQGGIPRAVTRDVPADDTISVVSKKIDDSKVNAWFNEALTEMSGGRVENAKKIYREILKQRPYNIEALNNLGVIALNEGNTKEALFHFRRIVEYRKDYAKAYNNIGLAYLRDGDLQKAEENFRKNIVLDGDSVEPYVNLSALYRGTGRFDEALNILAVPLRKGKKSAPLFLSYAVITDERGDYERANRFYRLFLAEGGSKEERAKVIDRLKYLDENSKKKEIR